MAHFINQSEFRKKSFEKEETASPLTLPMKIQGWDADSLAKMYFHHSEMQRQWAWEAISRVVFLGNEKILDFGCGDGKISSQLAQLVRKGSVLGVDLSEQMIHLARICFPRYAFPNLEFQRAEATHFLHVPGQSEYDLITAFSVFHLIRDPLKVLKNLKTYLKQSGKLMLTVPLMGNPTFYSAAQEMFEKYGLTPFPNSRAQEEEPNICSLFGCASLLSQAGYDIEFAEIVDTDNPFYDNRQLVTWMMGSAGAVWQIPAALREVFFTDVVCRMYALDPSMIDEEGRVRFKMDRMHIKAAFAIP